MKVRECERRFLERPEQTLRAVEPSERIDGIKCDRTLMKGEGLFGIPGLRLDVCQELKNKCRLLCTGMRLDLCKERLQTGACRSEVASCGGWNCGEILWKLR